MEVVCSNAVPGARVRGGSNRKRTWLNVLPGRLRAAQALMGGAAAGGGGGSNSGISGCRSKRVGSWFGPTGERGSGLGVAIGVSGREAGRVNSVREDKDDVSEMVGEKIG
jgi:hypothetical protein